MKTLKEIFEDFFDFGDRHAFNLNDGTHYEGYIYEILPDSFLFLLGGPLAPDEPIEIRYDDVNLDSLSFVKFSEHSWKNARWNINKWEVTDSK